MKIVRYYIILTFFILFIQGCSAAFVPYINDPKEKIEWSIHLTSVNRPLAARRILLGTFDKIDNNNLELLASYYRAKAYLIASNDNQIHRNNTASWTENIDGNTNEAEELYFKAISLFVEVEQLYEASNTSYLLSFFYKNKKNVRKQCHALKESLRLHLLGKENDPKKAEEVKTTYNTKSFEEFLNNQIIESKCNT